jgi:hypothetical protein
MRESARVSGCQIGGTHLSLATGELDVDETAGVCDSLLGTALRSLLLLLLLDLNTTHISDYPENLQYPAPAPLKPIPSPPS